MATNVTYASALETAINFLIDHEFDNQDVINKLTALYNTKTKSTEGKATEARKRNEKLVPFVVDAMRKHGLTEVRAKWVADNVNGINTTQAATAVLKVAVDLGDLNMTIVQKSNTRNECVYTLPTE